MTSSSPGEKLLGISRVRLEALTGSHLEVSGSKLCHNNHLPSVALVRFLVDPTMPSSRFGRSIPFNLDPIVIPGLLLYHLTPVEFAVLLRLIRHCDINPRTGVG